MYGDYLKDLLRPLRLYEVDKGYGALELEVLGEYFDEIFGALEKAEAEELIPSAEDFGLTAYERLLPYVPSYLSLADRRRAIEALIRIDGCSFTPAALQNTVSGCGILANVEETEAPGTVRVSFPNNRGVPENFESIKLRIEQILPCHLDIDYYFIYLLWHELESLVKTWAQFDSHEFTWAELERYG